MADSDPTEPTSAELRGLAAQAETLARRLEEIRIQLMRARTDGDPPSLTQLHHATAQAHLIAGALEETAADIARLHTSPGGALCAIAWGVCPEHGNTLHSKAGRTTCKSPHCYRVWAYDRLGAPCTEPASHQCTDAHGTAFPACEGHAKDVRLRMDGATVAPIDV
jgi:hypothetical protein